MAVLPEGHINQGINSNSKALPQPVLRSKKVHLQGEICVLAQAGAT